MSPGAATVRTIVVQQRHLFNGEVAPVIAALDRAMLAMHRDGVIVLPSPKGR